MKKQKQVIVAMIAVLVVSVTLGTLANSSNVHAQEKIGTVVTETTEPISLQTEKTLSVTGVATNSVEPDLLTVRLGIETEGVTAAEAMSANSQMMSKVVEALKIVGIQESEISTSSINLHAQYEYVENGFLGKEKRQLVGYQASNIVAIETKQLDLAAAIIDSAVSSGANRVDSVYFSLSPETHLSLKDQLLENAVIDAKKKAELALGPLDQKIIGVKSVSLSEFGMPYPQPMFRTEAAYATADSGFSLSAPTPVFSSEQDVSTSAHVVFLIGDNN